MRVTLSFTTILFQLLAIFSGLFLLVAIVSGRGSKATAYADFVIGDYLAELLKS